MTLKSRAKGEEKCYCPLADLREKFPLYVNFYIILSDVSSVGNGLDIICLIISL